MDGWPLGRVRETTPWQSLTSPRRRSSLRIQLARTPTSSLSTLAFGSSTFPLNRGPSQYSGSIARTLCRRSEGEIVMPHAHTVCVDAKTHLVYFPLENVDGHPILRIMEQACRDYGR